MSTMKLTPAQAFGDLTAWHVCCTCCDGFCPGQEAGLDGSPDLYRVSVNGEPYITDRRIAYRESLIEVHEKDLMKLGPKPVSWVVPDERPPESTQVLSPMRVKHITDAGGTIREGHEPKMQYLYHGDTHVGWLAKCDPRTFGMLHDPAFRGPVMYLKDIDLIRAYAEDLPTFTMGLHPWDQAALILNESRYLKEVQP